MSGTQDASVRVCTIDVCIVLDVTTTMRPCFEAVRTAIPQFVKSIEKLAQAGENLHVRVAVSTYSDHRQTCSATSGCDRLCFAKQSTLQDFAQENGAGAGATARFLQGLRAEGGADYAEDVLGGLHRAASLSWSPGSRRIVVWMGDAPCHGSEYQAPQLKHLRTLDYHTDGDPTGLTAGGVFAALCATPESKLGAASGAHNVGAASAGPGAGAAAGHGSGTPVGTPPGGAAPAAAWAGAAAPGCSARTHFLFVKLAPKIDLEDICLKPDESGFIVKVDPLKPMVDKFRLTISGLGGTTSVIVPTAAEKADPELLAAALSSAIADVLGTSA